MSISKSVCVCVCVCLCVCVSVCVCVCFTICCSVIKSGLMKAGQDTFCMEGWLILGGGPT